MAKGVELLLNSGGGLRESSLFETPHLAGQNGERCLGAARDMRVAARSDWVMDLGPGAGDEGGRVVASGPPVEVAESIRQPHGALFGVRTRLTRSCLLQI